MHFCSSTMRRWLHCSNLCMPYPEACAQSPMSQRSKLVQAGRMMSANRASPSIQTDWLTTKGIAPSRYAFT